MKHSLKAVFESIFWPAVAGNVFWSLCNLLLDSKSDHPVCSRVIVLILFSLYLSVSWLRVRVAPAALPYTRWLFESLHLVAIIFAALSAQIRPDLLEYAIYAYFGITTLGHLLRAWELPGERASKRYRLATFNLIGILVLFFGDDVGLVDGTRLAASLIIVLSLWLAFGRLQEICDIEKKLQGERP